MLGIHAPANAGTFDPAVQRRQVTLLDTKASAQCRDVQQIENLTDGESAVRQLEQVLDSNQQWIATTLALVSQGKRNEARILAVKLTKHGTNMRCVAVDVRDHHDDVSGPQCRVGAEAREQLIVEDLDFSLGAMGDVKTDRFVLLQIDSRPTLPSLVEGAQLEDVILQLVEHIQRLTVTEQVDAPVAECRTIAVGIVITVEQVDIVPPLLAPCGQQRVSMLMQGLRIDHYRHAAFAGLTLVLMPQQVFIGDDVRPMVTTRVMHAQQNLTESCQSRQCFQGLCRQRRNPENDHSRG
ncbi:hypothetical protein D9M71_300150 [compost metagenome]